MPWLPGKRATRKRFAENRLSVMGLIVFMVGHRVQVFGNKLGTAGNSSVLMRRGTAGDVRGGGNFFE